MSACDKQGEPGSADPDTNGDADSKGSADGKKAKKLDPDDVPADIYGGPPPRDDPPKPATGADPFADSGSAPADEPVRAIYAGPPPRPDADGPKPAPEPAPAPEPKAP